MNPTSKTSVRQLYGNVGAISVGEAYRAQARERVVKFVSSAQAPGSTNRLRLDDKTLDLESIQDMWFVRFCANAVGADSASAGKRYFSGTYDPQDGEIILTEVTHKEFAKARARDSFG